jgi:hypothetical protein
LETHIIRHRPVRPTKSFALDHNSLSYATFAAQFVAILLTAIITGLAYHRAVYGYLGSLQIVRQHRQYSSAGLLRGFCSTMDTT